MFEDREPTVEETVFAIEHLNMLIKGNQEVVNVLKLFKSERQLCADLRRSIHGQKQLRKKLKIILKMVKT